MKKYFDAKLKKIRGLFDNLNPVFQVRYENPDSVIRITLEAETEEEAKNKALQNEEFTKHIIKDKYDEKYLYAYKPDGLYVINKVEHLTNGKW